MDGSCLQSDRHHRCEVSRHSWLQGSRRKDSLEVEIQCPDGFLPFTTLVWWWGGCTIHSILSNMSFASRVAALKLRYEAAGQGHVVAHLNDDDDDKNPDAVAFLNQLEGIAVEQLTPLLQAAQAVHAAGGGAITPYKGTIGQSTDATSVERWRPIGMEAIRQGHVAVLVLAGGQGTRLGYSGPKGMYNIQLPSQKTLFCLLAERILRLRQLVVADNNNNKNNETAAPLPFYVMTSPLNHAETEAYFQENNYFGLGQESVVLFQQGMLPCLTTEGKIILESKYKVAMAPDGNGGVYPSLSQSGALADMERRGVLYLHICSIDNALVKPADPVFIGHCIAQNADCGNKSVWKSHAHEKVGVVALRDGKPCVVEYSELSQDMAEQTDAKGRLVLGAGNICNHFYTLDFLRHVVLQHMDHLYHIAYKKIPYYDAAKDATVTPVTHSGLKLESFIFDVFALSQRFAVFETQRSDEFAPVKNAPGASTDSPDTARRLISERSQRWLTAVGATLVVDGNDDDADDAEACCEVLPLTSYAGEGLEAYQGETIKIPFMI